MSYLPILFHSEMTYSGNAFSSGLELPFIPYILYYSGNNRLNKTFPVKTTHFTVKCNQQRTLRTGATHSINHLSSHIPKIANRITAPCQLSQCLGKVSSAGTPGTLLCSGPCIFQPHCEGGEQNKRSPGSPLYNYFYHKGGKSDTSAL